MSKEEAGDMPAIQEAAAAELLMLDPRVIVRSRTNPRTHFDEAFIKELAESIRKVGLAAPILVRPLPGDRVQETAEDRQPGAPLPTHEIIAGEQRWRACMLVELATMPVLVRHLDDKAVLELQLVENLKRQDLHPLEEAEGYDALMKRHGMTVEDIAAKVDKSASQIYVTLKLLDLTPECREEMHKGKLSRSLALLVARAPAELQAKIAKDILSGPYGQLDEPMSYRQAKLHIQQHYMLQLGAAIFDIKDASLVAKAGSCTDCQKRTGANRELFGDIDHADTCTDPKCFDAKKEAHHAAVAKAAQAAGKTVIQGKAAQELIPHRGATPKGYRFLDAKDYIDGRTQSVRSAIGKDALKDAKTVLIVDPHTKETREALPSSVAGTLLAKAKKQKAAAKSAGDEDKPPSEEELREQFEDRWHRQAIDQLHQAITTDGAAAVGQKARVQVLRRVAAKISWSLDVYGVLEDRLAELLGVGKVGFRTGFAEYFDECAEDAIAPSLMLLLLAEELTEHGADGKLVKLIAGEVGVDVKAIEKTVQAEMKSEAAQRAADAKAKLQPAAAKTAAKGGKTATARKPRTSQAEAKAGIAAALQEQEGGTEEAGSHPAVGLRVRIKEGVRGPTGHFRKISGRVGVLVSEAPGGLWNFRGDGDKGTAIVSPFDFEVIVPADAKPAERTPTINPQAAWPFPIKR
jgi:ParB/RepB/Spo0J family partition protein